ncbi:MAG: hypothetical protein WBO09_12140, partial [Methylocystis silviterrae]|uniref:hypothetical protein n=1 Tax=Methylocystis silviterrae TaxID=2743612 RepID=UPI003C72DE8D
ALVVARFLGGLDLAHVRRPALLVLEIGVLALAGANGLIVLGVRVAADVRRLIRSAQTDAGVEGERRRGRRQEQGGDGRKGVFIHMLISSSSRREFFVFVERCVEDIEIRNGSNSTQSAGNAVGGLTLSQWFFGEI